MQLREIIELLRTVAGTVVFRGLFAVVCLGCTGPETHVPTAPRIDHDPPAVVLRVGARDIRVRCALGCDAARGELTRLRDDCVSDPTSTPHQVTGPTPLVALGCCTEASHSFRRACGVEAIEGCASRWIAECESGTLAP